jgi:hypothetical protein
LLTIGVGNLELNKSRKGDRKGYVPLFNQMNDTALIAMEEKNNAVDSSKIKIINEIAIACKINHIKLFFVQSPIFLKNVPTYNYIVLSNTVATYNAECIDLSIDSLFLDNPLYFQDRGHLNNEGALVFSSLLANRIKLLNYKIY